MIKNFAIINFCLSIAVLVSMLFQSVHSYGHIFEQLSEKKCYHLEQDSAQITHDHHSFDHCFACEFTFSTFTNATVFNFHIVNLFSFYKTNHFLLSEKITFFSGSLFSLRGPPLLA